MSDNDDTKPPKRMQSQADRDMQGLAAKRERERDMLNAIPALIQEEITGNYQGEALIAARRRRATPQRIEHLEARVDGIVSTIGEFRADVGRDLGHVTAAVGELAGEVKGLAVVVKSNAQQVQTTFKAQVDVDTARELDQIDVGKTHRRWITQAIKIVPAVLALIAAAFAAGRC